MAAGRALYRLFLSPPFNSSRIEDVRINGILRSCSRGEAALSRVQLCG